VNEIEHDLLEALRELENTARALSRGGSKPDLAIRFDRIEALAARLPPSADADLVHYLRRKSYQKARLHLEGRAAENPRGSCRH
jgi:hypothetical protein